MNKQDAQLLADGITKQLQAAYKQGYIDALNNSILAFQALPKQPLGVGAIQDLIACFREGIEQITSENKTA